jgi:hypothetical protein
MKIEGSTMVYFNKQGHMITWWSEVLVTMKSEKYLDNKISKFDKNKDYSDEKKEKDDSSGSHDSGFQRLAEEQKAEEETQKLAKSAETKQRECAETEGDEDFMLSQSNPDKASFG